LAGLNNTVHYAFPGTFRTREVTVRAIELSQTATKLDPEDPRGHLSLGYAYALGGLYDLASSHFQLAYNLNENDPWVSMSASTGLGVCGELDRARAGAFAAFGRMPTPSEQHWGYLATVDFLAGDFDSVIRAGAHAPSPIYMPGLLAAAYAHRGQLKNAAASAGQLFARAEQRWVGKPAPTRGDIAAWFLQLIPMRSEVAWLQLRDGLHAAGGMCAEVTRSAWPNLADTDKGLFSTADDGATAGANNEAVVASKG
jgi:tetratricopeptide (TPR) repeat protein